jgi:DNA-3-methyladenine glycosylase
MKGVESARRLLAATPEVAARCLLGAHIESRIGGELVRIRLTEVEAYGGLGEDVGSPAFRRRTDRNAAMFGPPGHSYVYFTYGMHHCLTVVCRPIWRKPTRSISGPVRLSTDWNWRGRGG